MKRLGVAVSSFVGMNFNVELVASKTEPALGFEYGPGRGVVVDRESRFQFQAIVRIPGVHAHACRYGLFNHVPGDGVFRWCYQFFWISRWKLLQVTRWQWACWTRDDRQYDVRGMVTTAMDGMNSRFGDGPGVLEVGSGDVDLQAVSPLEDVRHRF